MSTELSHPGLNLMGDGGWGGGEIDKQIGSKNGHTISEMN